jgi:hypothetical protein
MRPTIRRPAKPAVKPVRRPRRVRNDDAALLAEAEAVLDLVVEKGWWSTATTDTLRANLERAKAAGVGPNSEGSLMLLGTVSGILHCYEVGSGLEEYAAQARRESKAKRIP